MTYPRLAAAALLSALALLAPTLAQARSHHHHSYHGYPYGLPYDISFRHNYGPGFEPGTFAYYDGPATNYCSQGSAAYIGQNHRRYPCF
jgi:hypothetical protein